MKKNKIILVISILLFICSMKIVNAANICNSTKYNRYKAKAYEIKISYELKFDKNNSAYFELQADNVSSDLIIIYDGNEYFPDRNNHIDFINAFEDGKTYEIKIYGGRDTPCVEEYLYTKRVDLPKYNKYSERDECIEYEEFPLCNRWYKGEIESDEFFENQLEEYKKSLEKKVEPKKVEKEEKSFFGKIIDFYKNYIIITLPITLIAVGGIGYVVFRIIKRRKNRVKIDF